MTNDKPQILSIIVPVYNVAPYLRKCVDSLLAQDYFDYEIILVDDGSTDDSGAICDEYASPSHITHHPSHIIRVIHQKNAGLSAARNTGIGAAHGQYVMFVDSDDYLCPNVIGTLMSQVEREQLDVLRFDYQNVRVVDAEHLDVARLESKTIDATHFEYEVFEPNKSPRYIDRRSEVVDGETYLNTRMGYACYAVQFLIRRIILIENNQRSNLQSPISNLQCEKDAILFTLGLHFEDVDWLPRMMLNARRVNSTPLVVYNYFVREGSITKTQGNKEKNRKNMEDQMIIMQRYAQLIDLYPNCTWLRNMQSSMAVGVLTAVARTFYGERKGYIERMHDMKVFPLTIANQGKTFSRRAKLINLFGPDLFCRIIRIR